MPLWRRRIDAFHRRSAERAVGVILRLGGIYVKIGQFASTMGAGILDDHYVQALRPLQAAGQTNRPIPADMCREEAHA